MDYKSCGKQFKDFERYWLYDSNWRESNVGKEPCHWIFCGSIDPYGGVPQGGIPPYPRFCSDCFRRNGFEW